jgi:hypothetical protein
VWWIIPLVIVAVVAGLAALPIGLRVIYDKDGLTAKLLVCFFSYKLNITEINEKSFERRMKTKKKMEENPDYHPPIIHPDGTLREFFPLLDLYLQLLFNKKYKLRVNLLEMKLTMANDDPFDLAMNYGKAQMIIAGLLPQLERIFNIKKKKIDVACDFLAEETMLYARADLRMPLARLLGALADFIAAEMKK